MSVPASDPAHDEIARVAHAIWEAEGQPEGRDQDHWMRARQLVEDGRAEVEYPQTVSEGAEGSGALRPVQPGFEDAAPGMVPDMKGAPGDELREGPGGRFAQQLAELPETSDEPSAEDIATPGPRNPEPEPPTNAEGYVAVSSRDEVTGAALGDDSRPPDANSRPTPRQIKDPATSP